MLRKEAQRRFDTALAAETVMSGLATRLVEMHDLPVKDLDGLEGVQRQLEQLRRSASEARREADALSASAEVMDRLATR